MLHFERLIGWMQFYFLISYFLRYQGDLEFFKSHHTFFITLIDTAEHSLQKSINLFMLENYSNYFNFHLPNLIYRRLGNKRIGCTC